MTTLTKMTIGFLAGITVGILYAPAKGSKTRERLSELGENIKDGWDALTDNLANHVEENEDTYTQVMSEEVTFYNLSDKPGVVL